MRLDAGLKPLMLAAVAVTVLAGCSRLTFVRSDLGRGDFERTAPEVDIRTDDRSRGAESAAILVRKGQASYAQGDYAAAASIAGQALKADPKSALAHTLLALVEDQRGNRRTAGEHYRQAVELAPTQGAMLNNYGTWLCGEGQAAESLAWFERAVLDPSYRAPGTAFANAGACAQKAGQGQRADQYLAAALQSDPSNPVALGTMAEREFLAGRAFQARAFSQRRLAAAPPDARALLLASQIEEKLGDKAAADRYVQQMITQFPAQSGSAKGE